MHYTRRGENGDGREERGQQDKKKADPVDSHLVPYPEARNPGRLFDELHLPDSQLKSGIELEGEEECQDRDPQSRPPNQFLSRPGNDQKTEDPNRREKSD